jgi:hypothetical protein
VRAARKANQLYDAGEKAKPPKGNQYTGKVVRSESQTEPKTLEQLGVSKQTMSEWRKLAAVAARVSAIGKDPWPEEGG